MAMYGASSSGPITSGLPMTATSDSFALPQSTVVCFHDDGPQGHRTHVHHLVAPIIAAGHAVLLLDLPGCGLSSMAPPEPPHSELPSSSQSDALPTTVPPPMLPFPRDPLVQNKSGAAGALLASLSSFFQLSKVVLLGVGWGCEVALNGAMQMSNPDMLERVILVAPNSGVSALPVFNITQQVTVVHAHGPEGAFGQAVALACPQGSAKVTVCPTNCGTEEMIRVAMDAIIASLPHSKQS